MSQAITEVEAKPLFDDYITLKKAGLVLDENEMFAGKPLPTRAFNYHFKIVETPLVGIHRVFFFLSVRRKCFVIVLLPYLLKLWLHCKHMSLFVRSTVHTYAFD